jgi:hypothetical protein
LLISYVGTAFLNYVLEAKMEEKTEGTRRRGTRSKQILDDLKDKKKYCNLKDEARDRTSGEIALEDVMDFSQDRLSNKRMKE